MIFQRAAAPKPLQHRDAIHAAQATIWVEDGIIYCCDEDDASITAAVARQRLEIHDQLSGDRRMPLLVVAGARARVDAEARKIFLGPETTRRTRAVAVVVDSKAARFVVNTVLKLARPATPFRLFGDRESARKWLRRVAPPE